MLPRFNITQSMIESKLFLFIENLGDESLNEYKNGLCNAFSFMNFRADILGKMNENLIRMQNIVAQKDDAIKRLAISYKEYKNKRALLIEMKTGKDAISILNKKLDIFYMKRKELREQSKKNKEEEDQINGLEEDINQLRNAREEAIRKKLSEKFDLNRIAEAEKFYIYIHTLIASFNPGAKFNFHIDGKFVNQNDYVETLQLIHPDDVPSIEKVWDISFVFTETQLIETMKKVIREGDFIRLGSTNHAIYLTYKNGILQLYDPAPIKIDPNSIESLVAVIKERFFTSHNFKATFLPISMSIFTKVGTEVILSRPAKKEVIEDLLKEPNDINTRAWDGTTSVWMAARRGDIAVIDKLIDACADLNIPNTEDMTPIYVAAQNGHAAIVDRLIQAGADVDKQENADGCTPLYVATQNGHAVVVDRLIQAGADVNNKLKNNEITPLYIAAQNDHIDIVRILLKKSGIDLYASISANISVLKKTAASRNRGAKLEAFLKEKGVVNQDQLAGFGSLHAAAFFGHVEVLKTLVEAGVNVETIMERNMTALELAQVMGHAEIIEFIQNKQTQSHQVKNDASLGEHSVFTAKSFNDGKDKKLEPDNIASMHQHPSKK